MNREKKNNLKRNSTGAHCAPFLLSISLSLSLSLFHFFSTILFSSFRSPAYSLFLSVYPPRSLNVRMTKKKRNAKNRIKREFKCFIKHVLYALQFERQCRKSPLNTSCWRTYFCVCRIFCIQIKKKRREIKTSVEKELMSFVRGLL